MNDYGSSQFPIMSQFTMILESPRVDTTQWFLTHAPHAQRICADLRGWHKEASYTFIDVRNQGRVAARHPADGGPVGFGPRSTLSFTPWHGDFLDWRWGAGNGCIPGAISLPHPEATETLASLEDDELCLGLSG